jgi:protoporphyrinogen oxidase
MRVGIIGGGVAGLTAALRLAQAGQQVVVFEKEDELGGQASTFSLDGARLERFYHHLFRSDREALALLDELGLAQGLAWLPSRVGLFYQGRIYPFVTPLDLLRFGPIPLADRLRLGLVSLYLERYQDWTRLEGVTAKEWITRHAGRRAYEVVWGPLLRAKFGDQYDQVGMVWFWGKVHLRFASRGQGRWQERLGYLEGSFGVFIEALAERIRALGGQVHTAQPVERIVVEGSRVKGLLVGGQLHPFDAVLATVPSPIFLRLAPDLPPEYGRRLEAVRYQAALCLVLALKRQFTQIYWLNISDPAIPFVGVIEQTNFVSKDNYGGRHIIYVTNYLSPGDPLYRLSAEELLGVYLPHLRRIQPVFGPDWVERAWVFREGGGQPIVTTNYTRLIPQHRTPLAGLYLANTTQIYPEDRGMNYSIRLGERVSQIILEQL